MSRPLILVADDNAAVLELMRVAVEAVDADIVTAPDGEEAMQLVHERCPDLLVLDLLMPRLDGLSVLARLRGDRLTRDVPVIVVSGIADGEASRLARLYGVASVVQKPFQPTDLADRVLEALGRARPAPPVTPVSAGSPLCDAAPAARTP